VGALLLRLLFCLVIVPAVGFTPANGNDFFASADGYTDLAYTLATYGEFAFTWNSPPTTFRGPPFPLMVAAVYRLLGNMELAVQVTNALASATSAVLAVLIAGAVLPRLSPLALYSAALLPLSVYYCASGFSDTFVAFTILLFVWTSMRLLGAPTVRTALACGLALGLALLTKPVILPLVLLLPVYIWLTHRAAWKFGAGAALVAMVVTMAWSVRNYAVDGHFRVLPQGGGFNALVGNYVLDDWSQGDVAFKESVQRAIAEVERQTGAPVNRDDLRTAGHFDLEPVVDARFAATARAQFRSDPALLVRKLFINWLRFWYYSSSGPRSFVSAAMNFPLLILAVLALLRWWRNQPRLAGWLAVVVITYVTTYALVIVNSTRYALFPLLVLAPFGAELLWRTQRARNVRSWWRGACIGFAARKRDKLALSDSA
jgi:hypothetical protein